MTPSDRILNNKASAAASKTGPLLRTYVMLMLTISLVKSAGLQSVGSRHSPYFAVAFTALEGCPKKWNHFIPSMEPTPSMVDVDAVHARHVHPGAAPGCLLIVPLCPKVRVQNSSRMASSQRPMSVLTVSKTAGGQAQGELKRP